MILPDLNPLTIKHLQQLYRNNRLTPVHLMEMLLPRLAAEQQNPIWIHRYSDEDLIVAAQQLQQHPDKKALPLYGIPFAVKDNIDVAGLPTTAACPSLRYVPIENSPVVQALLDAGALLIGKTNMDQLATGLVGTRSPYGACFNRFNPDYIAGGSSSGSGLAVGLGLVAFALGTDTAGSGRVPAALNAIVGYKPTRGILSTRGMVPACRHLDCVSIFANTTDDIEILLPLCAAFDPQDCYSRPFNPAPALNKPLFRCRIGILQESQQQFFGDHEAQVLYNHCIENLQAQGAQLYPIDYSAFNEAASLLYEGAFLAERSAGLELYPSVQDGDLLPVIQRLVEKGRSYSAMDLFHHQYQLQKLKTQILPLWQQVDVLFLPTIGPVYRLDEIEKEPLNLNRNLGYYTNFVNLLDLCAIALPAGFRRSGVPFGVSLIAQGFRDIELLKWGNAWIHSEANLH